jgi:hypothetical protein
LKIHFGMLDDLGHNRLRSEIDGGIGFPEFASLAPQPV